MVGGEYRPRTSILVTRATVADLGPTWTSSPSQQHSMRLVGSRGWHSCAGISGAFVGGEPFSDISDDGQGPSFRGFRTIAERAPAGTRTLTEAILSRLPLPIGLRGLGMKVVAGWGRGALARWASVRMSAGFETGLAALLNQRRSGRQRG